MGVLSDMKKSLFIILALAAFCGGCNIIGVLGSETYGNQKVPAQLDFSDIAKAGPLLVLVEPSHGSRIPPGLPAKLRTVIVNGIVKKTRVKEKNIIGRAFATWMSWDSANKDVRWGRIGKAIK